MLREFIKDEAEAYVGKAIIMLINYMNDNSLLNNNNKEKADKDISLLNSLKDIKTFLVSLKASL
jgi:hypothetical protein